MKNFKDVGFRNKGSKPKFGGSQFGRNNDKGGRPNTNKEMFSATCSTCHKSCDVPFRPSSDKPVYCSACFGQRTSENSRDGRDRGDSFDKGRHESRSERADFTKPTLDKSLSSREFGELKRQLITIEARLNRILDIINPPLPAKKAVVESAVVEDIAESTPVKKTATKKVAKKVTKKVIKKAVKKAVKKSTKK